MGEPPTFLRKKSANQHLTYYCLADFSHKGVTPLGGTYICLKNLAELGGTSSMPNRQDFFNIWSGQVGYWRKYRQRVGSGQVGVLKYTIGYFRVSFLLSGNSGYFRVIPGIPGNSQIICNPKHRVIPETSGNTRNFGYYPKFRVIPDISGYPLPEDFQN